MKAHEEIQTARGRKARWARSSQFWQLYMTLPTAPLFLEVARFWHAPRSMRTGDDAFDRKWHVFGTPEPSVATLLSPELRGLIASCYSLEWLRVEGDELCVSCMRRWQNDEPAMLALAEHLADALDGIAPPADTGALEAAKHRVRAIYKRKVRRFMVLVLVVIAAIILVDRLG